MAAAMAAPKRAAGPAAAVPTSKNTVAEIDAYAAAHGIGLAGCSTKAEKLARIGGAR